MSFANQLKTKRRSLSLTQAEAAVILEVSKSALEKWEAGTKSPKALMREGALARLDRLQPKRK